METLDFSHNWNNKLDCSSYTSLRLRNDAKYIVGGEYVVRLKNKELHRTRLLAVKHIKLGQINEYVARLDTGYSADECRKLILTMYKNKNFDWDTQELSLLLFERIKDKANDKIALWCETYERHCGVKYKVNGKEAKQVEKYDITEPLLKAYFESAEWWAAQKSLTGYMTHYNEIRRVATVGTKGKFPNGYDPAFEKTLNIIGLQEYWKHLRALGYIPKRNQVGQVVDWTKP